MVGVISVSFFLFVSLGVVATVPGGSAARVAIVMPLRSSARRDRIDAVVDLSVIV
jgi:hypothetical protein